MSRVVAIVQIVIRVAFAVELLLGVALWTGRFDNVTPLHIAVGVAIVLGLWTQAVIAARIGVGPGLVAFAVAWGVMLPIFGLTQERVLEGDLHWIVQIVHLAVGAGAVGIAEGLAARIQTIGRPAASATR